MELGTVQARVLAGPPDMAHGFVRIYDPAMRLIATADPVTRERWGLDGRLQGRMRLRWDPGAPASERAGKISLKPELALPRAHGDLSPWYSADIRVDRASRAGGPEKKPPRKGGADG